MIGLDVDVLLSWRCLRSLHIAGEELFGSLGTLLLEALGVILTLVRLEKLVRICASRDNHGRICASPEHSLIKRYVLGEVGLLIDTAIRILILLLIVDNARMGGEALPTSCF